MARPLTAKRVLKARKAPGRYPDGTVPGLYLQVTTPQTTTARGAASWILRFERGGVERMAGIGPLSVVSLAEARSRAKVMRLGLLDGTDPIEQRKAAKAAAALERARTKTFKECAEEFFRDNQSGWRSAAHAREYIRSLERHAFPAIGALSVAAIGTGEVMRVIKPLWERIPVTAGRLRQRIEAVLDFAGVLGYRASDSPNPARWSGHIEHLLPARNGADVRHFAALPYAELPAFMAELRARDGVAERALELAILCASRSGEVLHATWNEIDLQAGVWTIPGQRMKGGQPHRVPLSPQATALLEQLPDKSAHGPVFTRSGGRALGRDSLERALARVREGVTPHGMRSSFRDWCSERTAFPHEVCERALAHVTGSKSSRAYARSDLLDERRRLMEQWATFCYAPAARARAGARAGEVVTPLRKAARP
jgi:integrase